ncbi:uncharacterized protein LOC130966137 [Arachis stenosperma]|uniref:uncharacterized protein LOC130966137 n=1 Tax=Arachis stenosperma TaxID=217475 RepID=UPI0025ACCDD2|nr:uncharacterized protein LOC130966137 [Arachis stenosperma]
MTNKNHEASIKSLERQIGQISKQISVERPSSSLPSDTIPNPKEECKAIQLRSGRILMSNNDTTKKQKESIKEPTEDEKQTKADQAKEQVVVPTKSNENLKEQENQPHSSKEKTQGQQQIGKNITPPLPYPQRFNKEFLKDLINKKRSWLEKETILLTEECSAVIQRGIPPKLKDPGGFVVSCTIGKTILNKALCDLGASINLMPLSMMRKLDIEELKPTRMSLVMADRSIKTPNGIVENLLVKIGEFIFPADFVILDTEEEGSDSIILGRPFLHTARAIIDVEKGEMVFRVHNEQMIINVFKSMQNSPEQEDYVKVDMIESLVEEMLEESSQEQEGDQNAIEEQVAEIFISKEVKPSKKEEQEHKNLPRVKMTNQRKQQGIWHHDSKWAQQKDEQKRRKPIGCIYT